MKRTRIHIEGGTITAGRDNLAHTIRQLDGDYAVEFKKWSGAKTWEQIKTVKGVLLPALSEYTGETIKEAQRRMKMDYGVCEYFEKDGVRHVELKSFSGYTKAEMRTFIDGFLNHLEYDCGMIIDLETRKKLHIDHETGELEEIV